MGYHFDLPRKVSQISMENSTGKHFQGNISRENLRGKLFHETPFLNFPGETFQGKCEKSSLKAFAG
jgi:hypothetical protein